MSARVTSPTNLPHVDGLRGVAVLLVVVYHGFPALLPGGFIGVDVFFVVSGFVITRMLLEQIDAGEAGYGPFLARRARRLLPALLTVTTACLGAGAFMLFADEYAQLGAQATAATLYFINFQLLGQAGYFDTASHAKPLLHLWSLAIEEQFYLAWPLVLLWAAPRGRKRLAWTIALIALLSFVVNSHLTRMAPTAAFYLPFTRIWELAAGGWLATTYARGPTRHDTAIFAAGVLLLALGAGVIDASDAFPGWWALLPVLATLALIAAGDARGERRPLLSHPALVWLGLLSYPLYLWHWPLLSFASIVMGQRVSGWLAGALLLLSLLFAWATVHGIERHLRHRRDRASLVLLLAGSLLLAAWGWAVHRHAGLPVQWGAGAEPASRSSSWGSARFADCAAAAARETRQGWVEHMDCLRARTSPQVDIALVGDSHAEHLFPGLAHAAGSRDVGLWIDFVRAPFEDAADADRLLEALRSQPKLGLVIVAAHWRQRLRSADADYPDRLTRALAGLRASGKSVVVLGDVPHFSFDPRRCRYARLGLPSVCSESAASVHRQRAEERRLIGDALPAGIAFVELAGLLCDANTCWMSMGGRVLYRDTTHLTMVGSHYFAQAIVAADAVAPFVARPDAPAAEKR